MDDLISRKAAIDAVTKAWMDGAYYTETINAIKDLPTIEPVKHGKWMTTPYTNYDDAWECSVCGCLWTFIEGTPKDNGANYCPHCGAYMRGE